MKSLLTLEERLRLYKESLEESLNDGVLQSLSTESNIALKKGFEIALNGLLIYFPELKEDASTTH